MSADALGAARPVRFIQVGVGRMGQNWLSALSRSDDAELVGLVDLDPDAAAAAASQVGLPDLAVASTLAELAARVEADAVLNVTIPAAHRTVSNEAMLLGYPVLSEKPVAPTVAEAMSIAATSQVTGKLMMISQSRRYNRHLAGFTRAIASIGGAGILSTEFFHDYAPREYLDRMPSPLLLDMAIHPFDSARLLLNADPISVYCDDFNPSWSRYVGNASTVAVFTFADGARFSYTGSWCSPRLETSWNSRWRASGPGGTALWDGEGPAEVETTSPPIATSSTAAIEGDGPQEIEGALAEFISALRDGHEPSGQVDRNIGSLVMVEAAMHSGVSGVRVLLADTRRRALERAIVDESHPEVRAVLQSRYDELGTGD